MVITVLKDNIDSIDIKEEERKLVAINIIYNPSEIGIFSASSISTLSIDHVEKMPILMAFVNFDSDIAFRLQRGRSMTLIEALICHYQDVTCPKI